MPQLSTKQASLLAALIFALTLVLTYALPAYTITLSGLLIVIFLSVFISDLRSTLIAAGVSLLITVTILITKSIGTFSVPVLAEYLFIIFLICFITVLVVYMKRLNNYATSEKTHMTALFENATEGIILTNYGGSIILANPAAEKMFGYNSTELISQPIEVLIPLPLRKGHVKLRDGFYGYPQHRQMGWGRDLFAQKKSGENFPVEVSLSYYYQAEQCYVIAFIVDITHRKEIEESMRMQQRQLEKVTEEIRSLNAELEMKVEERTLILKEALQKLEESQRELSEALDKERQLNEIKSRFVSMASHEFRTPLSTVLSSASLLSKYTKAEEQDRRDKHISRIKESVKNLNDILEDFLSLGKLDEGKVQATPSSFDLKEFVEETIDDLRGLVKNGQQLIHNHNGSTVIYSDKKLLKNILINLMSNAMKFSGENGNVYISSTVQNGVAKVSVRDEGIGISEDDQEHLFTTFFRGKNAVNIQGTGLGLHIVKRYLDLINGEIDLKSKLGEGTTISIEIPVKLTINGKDNSGN